MTQGVEDWLIRSEERPFLRRVAEWADGVLRRGRPHLTDFMTPREQVLLGRVVVDASAIVRWHGGPVGAERQRALILPEDWPTEPSDFHIACVGATVPIAAAVSHGSVLGSVLGLGLERRKLGDIAVAPERVRLCICADLADHLLGQWRAIGRLAVIPDVEMLEGIPWPEPLYVRDVVDVVSPRADAVVAHACRLARGKAQELFRKKQVSLNYVELTDPDCIVACGDTLSVRGFGRVRVYETIGSTKSGRYRVEVGVLRSDAR